MNKTQINKFKAELKIQGFFSGCFISIRRVPHKSPHYQFKNAMESSINRI